MEDKYSVLDIALTEARNKVLKNVGWSVSQDGLFGAPPIKVFMEVKTKSGAATIS